MPGRSEIRHAGSYTRATLGLLLVAGLLLGSSGCTRRYFRNQADKEVEQVLAQKDKYADWKIENWWVYPDQRARFADPSNPDRPPMPPDDPATRDLSPNPQKVPHAGVERIEGSGYLDLVAAWDRENRARLAERDAEERRQEGGTTGEAGGPSEESSLEPPQPPELLPPPAESGGKVDVVAPIPKTTPPGAGADTGTSLDITKRHPYLMTLDQAAEMGMFNSREFQDRRENLYLAALPVTQERFAFAAQFYAAEEAIREYSGRNTPGGKTNNWTLNSGTGLSKLLPTGALLLLQFSNQTVFDFLNPKRTLSTTTLNFDALQPLLRGGGRAVTLEPLTLAERNLLYSIRQYARFRKEFYASIAGGSGGSISGGSFQPSGVLSGTQPSSFGGNSSGLFPGTIPAVTIIRTQPQVTPGQSGQLNLTGAITATPSGYLTTMLQYVQIYIDKENIDTLTDFYKRYQGFLEGDVVQPVQVLSVEQQLLGARSNLVLDQQQYLDSLDRFKIQIGVPTALSMELDDSPLRPLLQQFRHSRAIIDQEHEASDEAAKFNNVAAAARLRAELLRLFERSALSRGTNFARRIRQRWAVWEKMSDKELKDRLEALRLEARKLLDLQAELQAKDQVMSPADLARLAEVNSDSDLGNFERLLRLYEADYTEGGKPKKPDPATERRRVNLFRDVTALWGRVLVEARDERLSKVRASWPELPRCCVDGVNLITDDLDRAEAAAAQHALLNRLDLMNVRAQVVDSWRQLAVFANALLGTFNVEYRLSSNSPLGVAQPTNIGGSGNAHQLILNTDLPLIRKLEQNNYRASLIAYQRQRRALQEAEDFTVQAVRGEIHVLRELAENYRIQQRQLELGYVSIDNSLEVLLAPPRPGAAGAADGPAALTTQLLNAQASLPRAQNNLLTVWINYLNTRLQLYRDLELMPLDQRGVWIDEIRACDCGLDAEQSPQPVAHLPPGPNNSPTHGPSRLPRAKGWSSRAKLLTAGSALLALVLVVFGLFAWIHSTRGSTRRDLEVYKVKYDRIELSIVERGALESAKNSDIYCRVKARSQGSTVASQIKSVIDDGSEVLANRPLQDVRTIYAWDDALGNYRSRPGPNSAVPFAVVELPADKNGEKHYADLLVELDDSGLLEQLKTQKITVDKAESDKIQAEEAYKITVSQNDSDIKTAETQLELATITLMKYTGLSRDEVLKPETLARLKDELKSAAANARRPAAELAEEDLKRYKSGDYLAQLKDLLGQTESAKSDLSQEEDREAWAYRMVKKGYQTPSQAQAETSKRESLQLTLNKVSLNLDVLVKYTKISDLTKALTSDPTSAGGKGGLEEQQRNLERTKFQAKSKEVKDKTDREAKKSVWEQEVSKYKEILDEIKKCKVYAPQDGMVVYYIPDQARWGGGSQQSIVAQGEPVREGQKLMQIPDLKQMLVNTKVHEALITKVHPGQPALIRIDSTSTQILHGKVESVATVAAQQDWMAADVKVYTTKVAIDPEEIERYNLQLKPGMSAEVTILVADALEHVLTVPIQAIVGGSELGPKRTIVVMTPDGPKERDIVVGASNEKLAEVKEGLKEGDEIVLNPKAVLGDKIKVHSGAADKTLVVPDQNGDGKSEQPKGGKGGSHEKGDRGGSGAPRSGGPGAAEGGGRGPGGGGGGAPTEEQRKQFQAWIDAMKKATPEERKKKIEEMPPERREGAKALLKSQGIEIPD